jgi:hypothetical protein
MDTKEKKILIFTAWKKLLCAYIISFVLSFALGIILVHIFSLEPETLFEISTKRISYTMPFFDMGAQVGIDSSILLFIWNSIGALITISFIYTAALLNPQNILLFPHTLRKLFCGKTRMKLFCLLPGCLKIKEESLRRLYIWLMIPFLGIILLGIESGLSVSTTAYFFGSYVTGIISLLPHGIVEIPAITLAGAVTFSAHLLIKENAQQTVSSKIFNQVETYRNQIPITKIALIVICFLLLAGLIEAHITQRLLGDMLTS